MSNEEKQSSPAWEEGYDAGIAGQSDLLNPYVIGTDEAMDWEDGRTAYEDEYGE